MKTDDLTCMGSVSELIDALDTKGYDRRLEELRSLFDTYRADRRRCPDDPGIRTAQRLIELDAELCKTADPVTKRQHNSFTLRHVGNLPLSSIAMTAGITMRTVERDIDQTLRRIMVLAYGVDGVEWN